MSLQAAIESCLAAYPRPDTKLPLGDGHAEVRHRRDTDPARVCLHIARWTDGEEASVVPHPPGQADADLTTASPPPDTDYLDGDGMVFVSDDNVLMMASGMTARSMERYLRSLLEKAARDRVVATGVDDFELIPVADTEVAEQIRRDGVKHIRLGLGTYREAVGGIASYRDGVRARIWGTLSGLLTRDQESELLEASADVVGTLVLTMRRRGRADLDVADMVPLAEGVTDSEGDDEVVLETHAGQFVRRGQIIVRKKVDIDAHGKTVSYGQAWDEMVDYLRELARSGQLQT